MGFALWFFSSRDNERSEDARGASRSKLRLVTDSASTEVSTEVSTEASTEPSPQRVELSLRIRGGDTDAFTEFVAEYYERAIRVAYSVVQSRDVAQDIAQDVFFHLWQRRDTLHAARLTAGYVLTTVHHRALNVLKGERVRARYREEQMVAEDTRGKSKAAIEDAPLTQAIVHEILAELPERWQLVVSLRYQEQLPVPEIAAALGLSSNATHQLLHRAVRELRRRLGAL